MAEIPGTPTPQKSAEVRAAEVREETLPAYWQAGIADFLGRVQAMDPEYRFRWIQISPKNQQMKRMKGWEPLEDAKRIARYGFDPILINARGRVQWMDTELWCMPTRRAELIRKHISDRLARRSASVRATLDALADDVAGRSGNRVIPFVSTGTPGLDVFDRVPVSESTARSGNPPAKK